VFSECESDTLPVYQPVTSRLSEHVGLAGNIVTSSILKYAILSEFSPISLENKFKKIYLLLMCYYVIRLHL